MASSPKRTPSRVVRLVRRLSGEGGFTMIEVVMASVIFLAVATGIAGVLVSAITSHTTSRERTRGEELAQAQLEKIRKLSYANVGVISGNPPGTIPATGFAGTAYNLPDIPAGYTVAVDVDFVTDPGAGSYSPNSNYKKVTVTVTRTRDGRKLASLATVVAPTTRSSLGGITGAALTVKVKDFAYPTADVNSSVPGATVDLTGGPSPDRSDTTDAQGEVAFLSLLPTNLNPPKDYYDVAVSKTGYVMYQPDVSPAVAAHLKLAPTQVATTTLRIFKPATIVVALKNGSDPYVGPATVKVFSGYTNAWTTHAVNPADGTLTLPSIGGDPIYPNVLYTVRAYTSTGLCGNAVQKNVPDDYPNTMSTTFTLPMTTCPSNQVTINVKQLGMNVDGADITVSGGPNGISVPVAPDPPFHTDGNGNVTITNLPAGSEPYTLTATRIVEGTTYVGNTSVVVANPTPAAGETASITIGSPPLRTVNVTVKLGTANVPVALVSLAGGPFGVAFPDTPTSASGVATFSGVPVGTAYSLTASKSGVTGSIASQTVSASPTNATLQLAEGSLTAVVTQGGLAAPNAQVTVSGGPFAIAATNRTTDASGQAVFSGLAPGAGYTVQTSRLGVTDVQTVTVDQGPTTTPLNVALAAPPSAEVTVNVTWAGVAIPGAKVRLFSTSLGYDQTVNATDASGNAVFPSVPAGGPYTVEASKSGASSTNTAVTVVSPTTPTVSMTLPTKNVTVRVLKGTNTSCGSPASSSRCWLSTDVELVLSGGPNGTTLTYTGTTSSTGLLTIAVPTAPSGSFTVKGSLSPTSPCPMPGGSSSNRSTGSTTITLSAGASPTSLDVKFNSSTCPAP